MSEVQSRSDPRTFYYDVVDVIRDDPAREKITCVAIADDHDNLYEVAIRGVFDVLDRGARLSLEDAILASLIEKGFATQDDEVEPMLEIHAGGSFEPLNGDDSWA